MKKLIVILAVLTLVVFASGCIPGVTPVTPTPPPTPPPTPTTVASIITAVSGIDITSTATQYINKTEASAVTVSGTGPTYSEIKVYIDGIFAGTGDVRATGAWTVVVAKADLGKDGKKTMYVTAKEAGLDESDPSNKAKFTLDTVTPKIKSSNAKAGAARVYRFVETTDSLNLTPGSNNGPFMEMLIETQVAVINTAGGQYFSLPLPTSVVWTGEQIIAPFTSVPATNPLMSGVVRWKIEVIAVTGNTTIRVTNLTAGTSINYTYTTGGIVSTSWIPGLFVAVAGLVPSAVGGYCEITTTSTAATAGYIDVTFDENVTSASILATTSTWTAYAATVNLLPAVTVRSSTKARLTEAVAGTMAVGQSYSVSCSGIADLAGNSISATAPSTATGVVLP